ncbi:hypothetical protein [Bradyrhizobium guangzhouense]|uniref:Mandelate racemase n=1 Tax=Bradyrhizobium guangzhouense TaxID=1325095 RepID=A0AAE5X808_9BRAD|nr:hypothetical protein [Bradyrhizobium guangzhouense]QAU50346.1 hypothetical protein XH91_24945 [Bradyrhizobium guangzhouense]RXH14228.1 hypothetical protein EAS56_12875 [Bradyrhizobium guangzhouense]
MPPRLKLRDIAFFERPVHFARPFRFGAVTINATPQLFVRVEIELEGKTTNKGAAVGASAELLVPKWFDKRTELSPAQTVDDLRRSLQIASGLYLARTGFLTAFDLHAACIGSQVATCAKKNIPALAAAYGPAEIDKAILDALLRGVEANFFDGMAANIAGIDARLSPDLKDADLTTFLSGRKPLPRVAVRHTVGLEDAVEGEGGIAEAGANYFKLKLSGNPAADAARLVRIGKELDTLRREYKVTLDANEQYADLAALQALTDRLDREPALRSIASRLLYIEQPMPRDVTRQSPLGSLAARGFIIDEADDSYDAFPAARALGYHGISSKSCKGLYKSIVNATRAAKWSAAGEKFFVTGEDLTCQAGLAVQQDLALGAFLGVTHAERNGHHYVDGFGDAPAAEAAAFATAHPDLYAGNGQGIRLDIHNGDLLTGSLHTAGFATAVHPDWSALRALEQPKSLQEHLA